MATCPGETVADDEEDGDMEKSCPTPPSEAVWGLSLALSVTVKVPSRVPLVVGSKKTPMEQLAPGPRELPQVLSGAKSAGVAVTLTMVNGELPVLFSRTLWGRPDVPTYWLGNPTLTGDKKTGVVPTRGTAWGLTGELSLILTAAFRIPPALGEKLTLI